MSRPPVVSAVMIFLNGERFIREAIDSVLAQTFTDWELLLVDDGSTDGSTAIALSYVAQHPGKVHYLEHAQHKNRGMSASRNLGFRHARGAYLALLDADDVWLPQKFERQVEFMNAHADVAMVFGRTEYWHSWTGRAEDLSRDHVPAHGFPAATYGPTTLSTRVYPLGPGTAPSLCSLLIRAEAMEKIGGFEESFKGFYEDQAFLAKMYLAEPVAATEDCWDRYRIHDTSCSAVVRETGEYDEHRARFLRWLRTYLESQPHVSPEVWNAVNDASQPYMPPTNDPGTETRWLRLLRVAEGNLARLEMPADNPDFVRVAIAKTETGVSYDIQLNLPRLGLSASHHYALSFIARADQPRALAVGCAQGHAPWNNLGLYSTVELTSQWQTFELPFVAAVDEENARVHFDVGERAISVDISAVALRSLTDGRFVRPGASRANADAHTSPSAPIEPSVEVGKVDFGSFRRLTPISEDFGCDRGRPIDRHYIENFMAARGGDIRGHVLEIGDNTYTRRYGGDRVTKGDVLHVVEGEPSATIIADLTSADHIPSDSFDCVILTQTLQLIFDFRSAIRTIHRILKPGGILLATFPGISQSYDSEWGESWYWNFTGISARRIFEEAFGSGVNVETFGNALAAVSFLEGLAVEELTPEELDYRDPGYDVTIAVRAEKRPPSGTTQDGAASHRTSTPTRAKGVEARGLILMYHRVNELGPDPWSLCVSPANFSEHLDVLRTHAESVPLPALLSTLGGGHSSRPAVSLTFDDGYADNLLFAQPILERHGVPATVFVTSGYVGGTREFWWDELESLLLGPEVLPDTLAIALGGVTHQWTLGAAVHYSKDEWARDWTWRTPDNPPTPRHAMYVALWRLLQPLPESEQRHALDIIREWSGAADHVRPSHRALTLDELVTLRNCALIEIGAHTVTHPVLGSLPMSVQLDELRRSRATLEDALGIPVTSFAYPYGAYDATVVPRVHKAGFIRACSTVERVVRQQTSALELPRFEVQNWSGEEFERRLSTWLA